MRIQPGDASFVLNETDVYHEFAPPAYLRDSIACFWMRRGGGGPVRILPDACSDIVWRAGLGAIVARPDTGPALSPTRAGQLIVGARFLHGDRADLGRAALEAGYSDQAHLTRECRRLTGLSPTGLG